MPERTRARRPHTTEETAPVEEAPPPAPGASSLADEAKDWLDEIDAVLTENADEFVRQYVQRGGQ